ncbi:protein maelstrom homolog [Diorhabda carinulata]|uniref:protein maelstrom homolog n=1 Tax=Diorhabda carinulata TaxID=1163345 RepID=UPI0025A04421|nr:protein maelstrom homolog [Diorhabda carinulata]
MPRNQPGKNAFYYFMLEFRDRHGRSFKNMKEVADAAGPHWKNLSKEQRKPYEQQASIAKQNKISKLTSDGQAVDELERQEYLEHLKTQEMKDYINDTMRLASDNGRIQDEFFFIIHINTFCYCANINRYIPGEIAITCFSLEDGVQTQNVFHRIIKPGIMPLGYASEAKLISEQTHQLPLPSSADELNIEEVFTEMKLFLSNKLCGSKRYPPLYVDEKMMKMVQSILDNWCYDFGEDRPLFKIYNLQYMFRILRNTVANETIYPSDTYSAREIEKDVYAYTAGICCEYHSVTDNFIYCSRSITIRYAYIICDNCCGDLRIILVPGAHIPDQALTPFTGTRSSSISSLVSRSSKSSKLKTSIRDDDSDTVISFSSKSEWDNQSIVSDSSNLTCDSEFPNLGLKKKTVVTNSQPHFSSGDSSDQYSGRSYAGAMSSKGKPANFTFRESDDTSSVDLNLDFAIGRGRGTKSFSNNIDDFPKLGGGGRGRLLRKGKHTN